MVSHMIRRKPTWVQIDNYGWVPIRLYLKYIDNEMDIETIKQEAKYFNTILTIRNLNKPKGVLYKGILSKKNMHLLEERS